jgi:hypothetical protein
MLFPKWSNRAVYAVLAAVPLAIIGAITAFALYISPYNSQAGYAPVQPIPYSHRLHAGDLGLDCRYCHVNVEKSPVAMIPPAETCMNCHATVQKDNPEILKLAESYHTGKAIEWERVHKSPDYVYFDHSVHISAGVGCVSCHGRVDQMDVVMQEKPLSMGWCLDCHRNPEKHLRPKDKVTDMAWQAENQLELGLQLKTKFKINPTTDCSGCHR